MPDIAHSAQDMIANMTPVLRPGHFVFACITDKTKGRMLIFDAMASFSEDEGLSLILPLETAQAHDLPLEHPMACITLNVFSSLEGVGLTAAVAQELGAQNIPCNMVAAHHHDHVFIPKGLEQKALTTLRALQDGANTS